MQYFSRVKYQTAIVTPKTHKKWLRENPKYKDTELKKFEVFRNYWCLFVDKCYEKILENPSGVDLKGGLGNISVKILDIDFKCEKDFLVTKRLDKNRKPYLKPVINTSNPKKAKIVWKKLRHSPSITRYMGFEASSRFKKKIGANVRNREHFYQKAFHHDVTHSKCSPDELKDKSLFDLA